MKCTCGADFEENDKFCKNCGANLTELKEIQLDEKQNETEEVHETEEVVEESDIEIDSQETISDILEDEVTEIVDYEEEAPLEVVDNIEKEGKNNKKIIIGVIAFLIILIMGGTIFALTRSSVIIDDVEYANYPFATATLKMTNDKPIDESVVYQFYQDDQLVEDVIYNEDGEFSMLLNPDIVSGETSKLEIKIEGKEKVYDSKKLKISTTVFDNLFSTNKVTSEEYPNFSIETPINSLLIKNDFTNSISEGLCITVDDKQYPVVINASNGDTSILDINIDGAKRNLDFKYTYNYNFKDRTCTKEASVQFEPYNNITIERRKSDYSEYPIVRHYFDVYDEYGTNINSDIDLSLFNYYEMTSTGKTPIEVLNTAKLAEGGKSSVELVADVSDSLGEYGLAQTIASLHAFLGVVDFSSKDEVELISFNTNVYENQRFTSNKEKLTNEINRLDIYGATALYDALMHALDRTVIQRGSKMIIATTDGEDNSSMYTYNDVINKAQEFEIPIYIVGVGSDIDNSILSEIASSTGGEFIQVGNFNRLKDTFSTIYHKEKDGIVVEYDVNKLSNKEADVLVRLDDNYFGGEEMLEYNPIFVPWGGNVRVDDPSTPYDETQFDSNYYDENHRYEVVFADVSWQEANKLAVQKGGYLARITSEEEFDVITNVIQKATTSKSYLYWLGGSRKNSVDGTYTWVDQNLTVKSETLPDVLWLEGEPTYYAYDDNGNVMFDEEYLNMFYVKNIDKWVLNDVTDDVLNQYSIYKGKIAYVIEYEK